VLICFSWRGGEERKGDGLQFKLRVGVSGRGAAIAVPYRLQCTTAATWAASFQQDSQEPTATLSLSDSESDTAHTHTRALFASDASLLQQLRLVTPHRARRHASSLLRAPARRSPSPRAIMRLACRFVRPPAIPRCRRHRPPAMFRPPPAAPAASQQRSRDMLCTRLEQP